MEDDEISLIEIYEILRESWPWIFSFVVLGVGLALALAFVLPKKFQTSIYLEQPLVSQYAEINEGRTTISGLKWVTGDSLYGYFLDRLTSDAVKHDFFENTYLPSLEKRPEGELNENALYTNVIKHLIVVKEPVPKKGRQLYSVQIEAPTGELAVQWMRVYLKQAEDAAREKWIDDEQTVIDAQIKNIKKDLGEKFELTRKLREDREIRLGEALKVASAVGQQAPQLTVGQLPKQDGVAGFADGSSLYARGARSLSAEIEVLQARKDETAFIEGLRESQAKMAALVGQDLAHKNIGMYRMDGQLLEPAKPASPKKALMAAIGLLAGLFVGVVFAFARYRAKREKLVSVRG